MLHRILVLLQARPRDLSASFPQKISTRSCGTLHRHISGLTIDNKVVSTFCRYSNDDAAELELKASFHPKVSKPPDVARWATVFDRRFAEVRDGWRAFLLAGKKPIAAKTEFWLRPGLTPEELFQSLKPARILVSDDESVTIRFASSPHLKHPDLSVDLSAGNRVVSVVIEG